MDALSAVTVGALRAVHVEALSSGSVFDECELAKFIAVLRDSWKALEEDLEDGPDLITAGPELFAHLRVEVQHGGVPEEWFERLAAFMADRSWADGDYLRRDLLEREPEAVAGTYLGGLSAPGEHDAVRAPVLYWHEESKRHYHVEMDASGNQQSVWFSEESDTVDPGRLAEVPIDYAAIVEKTRDITLEALKIFRRKHPELYDSMRQEDLIRLSVRRLIRARAVLAAH